MIRERTYRGDNLTYINNVWKRFVIIAFTLLLMLIPFSSFGNITFAEGEGSLIPDDNLRYAINEALGKTDEEIGNYQPTEDDLVGLTKISAIGKGINNLEGLQYAKGLKSLYLDNNHEINDFSVINNLSSLEELTLYNTQFKNFSVLEGLYMLT